MPLIDLQHDPQPLPRLSVVGHCANKQAAFITHVGFAASDNEPLMADQEVRSVHMRPPLELNGAFAAHAAGHVPLTISEKKEIEAWLKEIADEYHDARIERSPTHFKQYVIAPPWEDVRDSNTGVRRYRRYSCAGFVLDGHLEVDIALLDIDESALPEVERATIDLAYADDSGRAHDPLFLARFGLKGPGPWPLVLPGYVIRALDRPTEEIHRGPYRARQGDELMA